MKKQIIYWTDTFEAGEYSRNILMKEEDVGRQVSENIHIGTEKKVSDTWHSPQSDVYCGRTWNRNSFSQPPFRSDLEAQK